MDLKVFQMLEFMNNRLSNIEKNINRIDEKLDFSIALQRNHLIRVKNGEPIDDSMILMGRPYNDLSPKEAFDVFNNADMDFLVIDVSDKGYEKAKKLEGSIHLPLEELETRFIEVANKTTPIMIISEKGLKSIKACELMIRRGYFNVNNISGGHEFWPGHQKRESEIEI